jgi:hypothetical protein
MAERTLDWRDELGRGSLARRLVESTTRSANISSAVWLRLEGDPSTYADTLTPDALRRLGAHSDCRRSQARGRARRSGTEGRRAVGAAFQGSNQRY